jgi:hypothetical protein
MSDMMEAHRIKLQPSQEASTVVCPRPAGID